MNVGYVKRWRSLALSILRVKGDFEIWRWVLLIASFPMFLRDGFSPCLLPCLSNLSKHEDAEKDSLGGVLDLCL